MYAEIDGEGGFSEEMDGEIIDVTKGEGVSRAEVDRWMKLAKRLGEGWKAGPIDINADPRPDDVVSFLMGESHYDLQKGKRNEVNNPFHLVRPQTLTGANNLFHYNKWGSGPAVYERQRSKRAWETERQTKQYVDLVRAYEGFAIGILDQLNEPDATRRIAAVRAQAEALAPVIRPLSKVDLPAGWLAYDVLSILDMDNDAITMSGRLRAVELLQAYTPNELALAFRVPGFGSEYHNGYDEVHVPRLPYTFAGRDERLTKTHKDIWKQHPSMQQVVIRDSQQRVDWRATTTALLERAPEEAIQIVLLLLHDKDTTEGAFAFLQQVPKFDKRTLARMFGKRATFMAEHQIARGVDVAVTQGAGVSESPGGDSEERAEMTIGEMRQIVRRKERLAEDLQERLAEADAARANLLWKNHLQRQRIAFLEQSLAYWSSGRQGAAPVERAESIDAVDPNGYYRILGLHPDIFDNLTEVEVEEVIKRNYRLFAKKYHSDVREDKSDDAKMKQLNNARDELSDPEKRRRYGKR